MWSTGLRSERFWRKTFTNKSDLVHKFDLKATSLLFNVQGTERCDHFTGQCICKPGVEVDITLKEKMWKTWPRFSGSQLRPMPSRSMGLCKRNRVLPLQLHGCQWARPVWSGHLIKTSHSLFLANHIRICTNFVCTGNRPMCLQGWCQGPEVWILWNGLLEPWCLRLRALRL